MYYSHLWRKPSYLKELLKLERLVFTAVAYLISVLRYLDLFDMLITPPHTLRKSSTFLSLVLQLNRSNVCNPSNSINKLLVCWFSTSGYINTHANNLRLKWDTREYILDSWLQHVCDRPLNNTNIIISVINFNINMD